MCACGTPWQAYWYAEIIYGTDDQTDYEYGYFCHDHKPRPSDLRPHSRRHWKILEHKVNKLPHALPHD